METEPGNKKEQAERKVEAEEFADEDKGKEELEAEAENDPEARMLQPIQQAEEEDRGSNDIDNSEEGGEHREGMEMKDG